MSSYLTNDGESFRRKKSGRSHQKRAMLLIERIVWNVGNNKKKGSWEQGTVGLMLFRFDYAGTKINIDRRLQRLMEKKCYWYINVCTFLSVDFYVS